MLMQPWQAVALPACFAALHTFASCPLWELHTVSMLLLASIMFWSMAYKTIVIDRWAMTAVETLVN